MIKVKPKTVREELQNELKVNPINPAESLRTE